MAERLGWDDEQLVQMRDAAMLHDVGKVRLDPDLVEQLGHVEETEMDSLHLHAVLCEELLSGFDFLVPCIPWIRHHHEWWDGTGFPDNLIGLEIPLGARILGVAEAFDVLAYRRTAREARDEQQALRELRDLAGQRFDPALVELLAEVQPLIQPLV